MSSKLPHALSIVKSPKEPRSETPRGRGQAPDGGVDVLASLAVTATPQQRHHQVTTQFCNGRTGYAISYTEAGSTSGTASTRPFVSHKFVAIIGHGARHLKYVTLAEASCFIDETCTRENKVLNYRTVSVRRVATSPMLIITHPCKFVRS